jgi:membrane protein DedA with SNARE-associated domain
MLAIAAIFTASSGLGYLLPALIGLESMGVPSPGETALVLAAVLASQGKLNILLVIVIAIGSAILGDNVGYLLGRHLGRDVLESKGPFHQRRAKVIAMGDRYFKKHGAKTVFIGRWIALIRFATAWLAGINEMRFLTFFMWNAAGAVTWATTYGLVGYFGGNAVAHVLERVGIIAAIVLAVAVVAGFIYVEALKRHKENRLEQELELEPEEDLQAAGGSAEPPAADPVSSPDRSPVRPS